MSLRLLIDEDSQAKPLLKMLRSANHNVLTVKEVGLQGQIDSLVFEYAIQNNRVLLTHNCDDFEELHETNPNHLGILAIYKNNDPSKDMDYKAIIKAIVNIEKAGFDLTNQFIAFNYWNY